MRRVAAKSASTVRPGLLVPIEDPPALAEAIARLAQVRLNCANATGRAARQIVVDKLSAKIVGRRSSLSTTDDSPNGGRPRPSRHADIDRRAVARTGKIVLVSQHYAPFPSTTAGYMTDIAQDLPRQSRVHRALEFAADPASGCHVETGEPEVIEIKSWWPEKSALVSRSFAAVLFAMQVFIAVMKHTQQGRCAALRDHAVHDALYRGAGRQDPKGRFGPDHLRSLSRLAGDGGLPRANSILTKVLRWANQMMFRRLDAIVVIGRDMSAKLLEYPKMNAEQDQPHSQLGHPARRLSRIRFRQSLSQALRRKFIAAMSGNAGFTHDPESVFEAARILKDNPDIISCSPAKASAGQRSRRCRRLLRSQRHPARTRRRNQLESFLSAADIWIIPYRRNNTGVSVPSRIYNFSPSAGPSSSVPNRTRRLQCWCRKRRSAG